MTTPAARTFPLGRHASPPVWDAGEARILKKAVYLRTALPPRDLRQTLALTYQAARIATDPPPRTPSIGFKPDVPRKPSKGSLRLKGQMQDKPSDPPEKQDRRGIAYVRFSRVRPPPA